MQQGVVGRLPTNRPLSDCLPIPHSPSDLLRCLLRGRASETPKNQNAKVPVASLADLTKRGARGGDQGRAAGCCQKG